MKKLIVSVVIITCVVVIAVAVTSTYLIGRHTANQDQQQKYERAMRIAREYAEVTDKLSDAHKEFERIKQTPGSYSNWQRHITKINKLTEEKSQLYKEVESAGILQELSPYPEALSIIVRATDRAVLGDR